MEIFLDMCAPYHQFFHTKHIKKVDYYWLLQAFDRPYKIPKNEKGETYASYVESLVDCLAGYLECLQDLNKLVQEVKKDFDEKRSAGRFPGWRVDTGQTLWCQTLWGPYWISQHFLHQTGWCLLLIRLDWLKCDRLCINRPFTAKWKFSVQTKIAYRTKFVDFWFMS